MSKSGSDKIFSSYLRRYSPWVKIALVALGILLIVFSGALGEDEGEMSEEEKQSFLYVFFPFMFGIYPYGEVTEKQRDAMEQAGVEFAYQSVYEITYQCLIRLL